MSKLSTVISFFAGAAIGGAAVWYLVKDKYAKLAEEEINSVKETYARKEQERITELGNQIANGFASGVNDLNPDIVNAVAAKVPNKGSITEYARRIQNGEPMQYSTTVVPPKSEPTAEDPGKTPYVIPPEEFDELDGYTPISLTFFADGVLSDEYGVVVDDVEGIIGDGLNHFGEYEEDSVFVRNDAKRCDYEILRDERKYEEFRKTLPPNI